jgi:site-specific recombinase XerD
MIHCFNVTPEQLGRFQTGPLGPHLPAYAGLLHQRGYTYECGWGKMRQLRRFSHWLERKKIYVEMLNEQVVSRFLAARVKNDSLLPGERATFTLMIQYLRQGRIIPVASPAEKPSPAESTVQDYQQYLLSERSLGLATVKGYTFIIRRFLSGLSQDGKFDPQKLKAADIIQFVQQATTTIGRRACQHTTTALRSLLRFLLMKGQIKTNLAAVVPKVAGWRLSELPRYLEPAQVEKVLKICDRHTDVGKRNYAILLLLARLGLRAGEVIKLNLADINWTAGEVCIRGKGARIDRLPLLQDVGAAIADYLQKARPRCSSRCIFVHTHAPYEGFASPPNGISCLVRRALKQAGLNPPHKGAHILRHSLATRMLNHGASLSQIGRVLRHKNIQTTEIYAKVDLIALRKLAQPWPGGVL